MNKLTKSESGKLGAIRSKELHEARKEAEMKAYTESPIICKECNNPHSYDKRKNKFCSASCATSHNNKLKTKKDIHYNECLSCKNKVVGLYCNTICQKEYEFNERVKIWLSGEEIIAKATFYKKFLTRKYGYKCSECGISDWQGKVLVLELEHKDGNSDNNVEENLCLLCPNCHSQTSTFKGRNKGSGRHYRRTR